MTTRAATPNRFGNYYERAAYRALHARSPEAIAAEKAQKAAEAKTCQICGRQIFAETGAIAHHGYERPHEGWQTASCEGARHLPFEVSRDLLRAHIAQQRIRLTRMVKARQDVGEETAPVVMVWEEQLPQNRTQGACEDVTRESFPAFRAKHQRRAISHGWRSFDTILESDLDRRQRQIKALQNYIAEQQARADGWRATHRRGAESEATWVAV